MEPVWLTGVYVVSDVLEYCKRCLRLFRFGWHPTNYRRQLEPVTLLLQHVRVRPLFRKLSLDCAFMWDKPNLARKIANIAGTSAVLPQPSALFLRASLRCRRFAPGVPFINFSYFFETSDAVADIATSIELRSLEE